MSTSSLLQHPLLLIVCNSWQVVQILGHCWLFKELEEGFFSDVLQRNGSCYITFHVHCLYVLVGQQHQLNLPLEVVSKLRRTFKALHCALITHTLK